MKKSKSVNKAKVRFPLKLQYTVIFASLMAGIVCASIVLSTIFLPKYYESEKIKSIRNLQTKISQNESYISNSQYSDELSKYLDDLSMRDDLSIIILSEDSDILYSSKNLERNIDMILVGYILGLNENAKIQNIEEGESYIIRKSEVAGGSYLELYGQLSSGIYYLVRTPLESIGRAASYANRFYLMIGLSGIVISAVIIFIISNRISKPILKMSEVSERMVNLDFDARYDGADVNEIGLLGNNINHLSESLEKSISELKTANNELKRDIEKKEKSAEEHREFISNVSHELKTPIALIQGYAEGLKEGISDDPESRDYYCDVIMDEASKMNNMVRALLNLDQLESGEDVTTLERFDVTETISNYLQSAKMLADKENIKVFFEEKSGLCAWGDPFKAETVLTNYFSNAIHYCKEAGGEKYIRIYTEIRDKILRVCVFNTGDPIPEDALGRVWDKFYKVDKARTRSYGGSGVGLSIVRAIQNSIGQGYGAFNEDNGVVFWFELEM